MCERDIMCVYVKEKLCEWKCEREIMCMCEREIMCEYA